MKLPINMLSLFLGLILFTSCGSGGNKSKEQSDEEKEISKIIDDIDQLLKDLPPPSLVPFSIQSINAKFDRRLVNKLDIDKYRNNNDKMALNMGVYASDINYFAAYGYKDDCVKYFKGSHSIAQALGDSTIFTDDLLARFKERLGNKDELSNLLSSIIIETSLKIKGDHHLTIAGLALTGSFIEGLYQAVMTIETFPETKESNKLLEPLVKIVIDEEKALSDIVELLKDLPFDGTIAKMITELSILDRLYKNDLQKIEEKIKTDPNFTLTKDVMRVIILEVKRVRADIVE